MPAIARPLVNGGGYENLCTPFSESPVSSAGLYVRTRDLITETSARHVVYIYIYIYIYIYRYVYVCMYTTPLLVQLRKSMHVKKLLYVYCIGKCTVLFFTGSLDS